MKIITGCRDAGKTTELIKLAAQDFLYIVCANNSRVEYVMDLAKKMELDIPFPITFQEFLNGRFGRGQHLSGFAIDDVDQLLREVARGTPVKAISLCVDKLLPGEEITS